MNRIGKFVPTWGQRILAGFLFLLLVGGAILWMRANQTVHAQGARAVVVVLCRPNFFVPPPQLFIVESWSSSTNAPSLIAGDSCAQSIANLLSQGFKIEDVQLAHMESPLYTLTR